MKRLLPFLLIAAALAACADRETRKPATAASTSFYKPGAQASAALAAEKASANATQSPEQKSAASIATKEYFDALRLTIAEIDDGTSPADVIARAAVARHVSLLRAATRAQVAHISQSSALANQWSEEIIATLPRQEEISGATYLVLQSRKNRTLR